jgi:cathepsin A (carboxypeptidase C)
MMKAMLLQMVLLLIGSIAAGPKEDAKFTEMPNINGTMKTDSYSGYLDITVNKSLHYVFVTSENDPTVDPVVVWFNGGPGCSSLLAFFQENGPFVIDDGETWIKENPFPWNKNLSMLYLESPAGVGYSVGVNEADRNHSDMSQSQDAFAAL